MFLHDSSKRWLKIYNIFACLPYIISFVWIRNVILYFSRQNWNAFCTWDVTPWRFEFQRMCVKHIFPAEIEDLTVVWKLTYLINSSRIQNMMKFSKRDIFRLVMEKIKWCSWNFHAVKMALNDLSILFEAISFFFVVVAYVTNNFKIERVIKKSCINKIIFHRISRFSYD